MTYELTRLVVSHDVAVKEERQVVKQVGKGYFDFAVASKTYH